MSEKGLKDREDCEEEECVAVKGCKRGRPVKVRLEEDCEPLPVRIVEEKCDPIDVKIRQKHCDPLVVRIKQEHCDPLRVKQSRGDCWEVQGCGPDAVPVNVNIVNQPPPPAANANQWVWTGTAWEEERTPSKFIVLDNLTIDGGQTAWQPAPGMRFRLMGFQITSSLAGQVNFHDGVGGPVIYSIVLAAGVPFVSLPLGNGIPSVDVNRPLALQLDGGPGSTASISGIIMGQEHP